MAAVQNRSTRIIAETNRNNFKTLKTTSDRYPTALAR